MATTPEFHNVPEVKRLLEECSVEVLKGLHVFLYENSARDNLVKRNIREFRGFKFVKGDAKYEKRIKVVKNTVSGDEIAAIAEVLSLKCDAESLVQGILDWLIESSPQRATRATNSQEFDERSICSKSRRSILSHAEIEVDLAKKELEIEEKLAVFEEEIFALQEEIIGLEDDIKRLELSDLVPEASLTEKRGQLATAQKRLELKRSRLSVHQKLLEKQRIVAQREASAMRESIEENDEGTGESDPSHSARVVEWLHTQGSERVTRGEGSRDSPPPQTRNHDPGGEKRMDDLTHNINRMLARQTVGNNLGKFDGSSSLRWPIFLSQFKRSSEVCGFSPAENVLRLDECLTGEARKKVEMLLITASDPEEIIKILSTSYGKQEVIAEELATRARSIPNVDTLADFENFSCDVRNVTSALENIKGEFINKRRLLSTLVSKLPPHLMTQWGSYLVENQLEASEVTLRDFTKWSQNMSSMLSKITFLREPLPQSSEQSKKNESSEGKHDKGKSSASENKACIICQNGQHSLDQCSSFKRAEVKQRWKMAEKAGACYCCLQKHSGKCRKRKPCGLNDCPRFHNALLHKASTNVPSNEATNCTEVRSTGAILKMLPVRLRGPSGEIETVAFLDDGSTGSLIDADLAKKIGLVGPSAPLCCKWTGATFRYDPDSEKVSLSIAGPSTDKFIGINNVRTVHNLGLTEQSWDVEKLKRKFPYVGQVDLAAVKHGKPMILIGQAHAGLIISREIIQPHENAPILSKTDLGWTVHGPTDPEQSSLLNVESIFTCCEISDSLHEEVKKYFSLENFGAAIVKERRSTSTDEERAIQKASTSIKKLEKRYEINLPWKTEEPLPGGSKEMALQRLRCLEKKLLKNEQLGKMYQAEFEKLIQKGYAVEVEPSELIGKEKLWFLPHFGVVNLNKPGKVRLVFDAAAKVGGKSLNDHVLTGPDWLTSLFGIIIKFRQFPFGFTADIREMFNRVKIAEDDSYAQCFLWRNLDSRMPARIYRMTAMIFGMASSPFLAQFVKNHNAEKFRESSPDAVSAIVDNHYVDDYLHGANSEEEGARLIKDVIEIHEEAGFELRNFASNSREILKSIPENLVADSTLMNMDGKSAEQRILGMIWDALTDRITFSMNFGKVDKGLIEMTRVPTKREVLKVIMSAFDPMGFLSPITVKGRMLLQRIWRAGIGWDDFITAQMFNKWKQWLAELKRANTVHIPRYYSTRLTSAIEIQLHTFCDASELAYAAASYLRIVDEKGVDTILIASKARVAPLRTLTVPKLELMAAVLAARLAKTVKDSLNIQVKMNFFWSDSATVLNWLGTEKKLSTFEAARVGEILELSNLEDWNWVPTKENVADDCTRDTPTTDFNEQHRWFNGPDFLELDVDEWPRMQVRSKEVDHEETEITMALTVTTVEPDALPEIKSHYTLTRLLRTTGWMKRFIDNARAGHGSPDVKKGPLEVAELEWAEKRWWRAVQKSHFREEREDAANKRVKKQGKLKRVDLEIDSEGLLRISGRLSKIDSIDVLTRSPVCLDGEHKYVKLMIEHYHRRSGHQGFETVLNELRKRFWIPKTRAMIKKIVLECMYCRKKNCKPAQPKMAPLPMDRVLFNEKAFTATGMDYFGPFQVKIGRRLEKRYGVLFTCLTIRAIHVEVAHTLNTDSCILAIRRFLARRGAVRTIWSDNGTNLRGANRELLEAMEELDEHQLKDEMTNRRIEWRFNPPAAPHMGGSWERMVRSVKRAIYATMKERHLTDEMLRTVFTEAEYIVNSRPLTYVSSDSRDLTSISPNDILIGQSFNIGTPGYFTSQDETVKRQWRISQYLINLFWKRWFKEYLPTLNHQSKWFKDEPSLKNGELVLIGDGNLPRATWPMGVIQQTYQGRDGVVRMAEVRTATGVKTRPAVKLHRLEMYADNRESAPGGGNVTTENK